MRFLFSLSVLAFFLFSACTQQEVEKEKPNILFILTDDQRADALGVADNEYIQTPHIDKLAANGVRFTNNYCMGAHHGAVCAPSRAMLMSGKSLFNVYDRLNGVTTMPKTLRANGYVTFGTGKWHNEKEAFAEGFEIGRKVMLGGMSDHFNVPLRDLKTDSTFTEMQRLSYSTDIFADEVINFLNYYQKKEEDRPFFAYLAFTAPHDPRSPEDKYIGYYKDKVIPPPPNFLPQHPFNTLESTIRDENLGAYPRTEEQISRQLADYYGLITHIDDRIGDIVGTLNKLKLLDNTIIVFTSDHGLGMGSHGLLGKQNLYEHSMKSPLIISGPGIPKNQKRDALVYLYDLFPTLCSFTDIQIPEGVEGENLSAVIGGESEGVRKSLFTAYRHLQRAVRDDQWKLIRFPKIDHTLLYDLKNDPFEINNLAGNPDYVDKVAEMTTLLKEWQQSKNDTLPLTAQKLMPKEYSFENYLRFADPHQPEYCMERYFPEVLEDPLRNIHFRLVRASAYENSGISITRNYNVFLKKLREDENKQDEFLEKCRKAAESGILDKSYDKAVLEAWLSENR